MAKYLETRQMAELYQAGHTMQQIADAYLITKQTVSQRLALAGIKRRLKIHKIDKPTLERIYTIERLPVERIAEHFGTHRQIIRKALTRYKIPTRPPLKTGGPIVDQLRALKIGASVEIGCQGQNPYSAFHRAAFRAEIKVRVHRRGKSSYIVTRI